MCPTKSPQAEAVGFDLVSSNLYFLYIKVRNA